MTKKEKQLWLEAIGKLRRHYEKYPLNFIPVSYFVRTGEECSLCIVAKKCCADCLWVKFENNTCIGKLFHLDTTQERLDRLDRWEKKLREIK